MRTLSEVFASRGPLLPEGLRTLEVSPERVIEPGTTVTAAFTFRNLGGGTASGFRVRFRLPEGLTYLVGTARVDDAPLDEQGGLTTLLQASGADIGEIPAGGQRRVSLAYTVDPTIENGTPVALQAAIASFDVPVIGSNIVRLVVSSRPLLQNAKTTLTLSPVRDALPGQELQLNARIHNSGQSSAHDLVVLLPVPPHTTFSPNSVTVEGRSLTGGTESEPFGFARPTVVAPTLGPGATLDVGYKVRIDAPLEDATAIVAQGAVCTQEVAEFTFPPVTLKIPSAASFAGDETALRVECDDEVEPGQRVRIVVHAKNTGTARARKVALKISLPDGFAYTHGSLAIDGAASPDHGGPPDNVLIGDLEPGRAVELALSGVVQIPLADGQELRLGSLLTWSKGQRKFERTITVRSAPRFPLTFNKIERETPRCVGPGDTIVYTVVLRNMGTDIATDVWLQLTADPGVERLRVRDRDTEMAIGDDGMIGLEALEPGVPRLLRVDARVAGVIEDQSALRLHATLLTAQLPPVELGAPFHVVASRPSFSVATSHISAETGEALRPNRLSTFRLALANDGTDRGRDVRVTLMLPDELRLERVDDATRDGNTVVFGDVLAGETRAAALHVRLVGIVSGNDLLTISARVGGLNVVPFSLGAIDLATHAEASFAEGATLTSVPAESIDAGSEIAYTLSLRNCGDGSAKRVTARVSKINNAVYAPGSTTVNGIALQDYAGTSPLLSEVGLMLADVGPGVEVIARWRVIVNTPLPPATAIETGALVVCDDTPEMAVVAPPVRVRSTSALPIIEPGLPFSVLGAVAAPGRSANVTMRADLGVLPASYVELRPAVPVRGNGREIPAAYASTSETGSIPVIEYAQLSPGSEGGGANEPSTVCLFLDLADDHLAWVVQYLEQTRVGGLVSHLLTLRALFPDRVGGADRLLRARLRGHREMLAEHADRLFIKVRLPDFPIAPADVETPELRASLISLIDDLARAKPERASLRSGLRLVEWIDGLAMAASLHKLGGDNLATAAPWQVMATMIGTTLERDGGALANFSSYRDKLVAELALRAVLDADGFEASLREPVDPALDEARGLMVRALSEQQRVLN